MSAVPVTVLTGFVGAGKTTLLLSLLRQIPQDYKVVVLKNEYGDLNVDSQLVDLLSARSTGQNISSVKEMTNGCICCVLVGQLKNALLDILSQFQPLDRIIIESSGSAQPASIVWQLNELPQLKCDGVLTVVDALNFPGYEDVSYTAKLQAKYCDLLILNKVELCTERQLDLVIDRIRDVNEDASIVYNYIDQLSVNPELVFGIQRQVLADDQPEQQLEHWSKDVQSVQLQSSSNWSRTQLEDFLNHQMLTKDLFYRIKGFVVLEDQGVVIVNWAFGRFDIVPTKSKHAGFRLTVMGRLFVSDGNNFDPQVRLALEQALQGDLQEYIKLNCC